MYWSRTQVQNFEAGLVYGELTPEERQQVHEWTVREVITSEEVIRRGKEVHCEVYGRVVRRARLGIEKMQ